MGIAFIQPDPGSAASVHAEESIPLYSFQEELPSCSFAEEMGAIPQLPLRGKNRMLRMRANEALMNHLLRKMTLGEITFNGHGIHPSPSMKMGSSQYCYLSALGYWVVSHQKVNRKIQPGYFNAEIQIPKINPKKKYELELDHREFKAFDVRNTRIDIAINGRTVLSDHSPGSLEFVKEIFDISKYLQNGNNTLTISFSKNGETIYAIRSMKITES